MKISLVEGGTAWRLDATAASGETWRAHARAPAALRTEPHLPRRAFIQIVLMVCLDGFIVMGTSHPNQVTTEFNEHHNRERPHSSIENRPPVGCPPRLRLAARGAVRCRTRLRGAWRHFYRQVA